MFPSLQNVEGVQLVVAETQSKKAMTILQAKSGDFQQGTNG
jgi:hypothetical protein